MDIMSTQKAVLWDLDNTLMPSIEIMEEILKEILPPFNLVPPDRAAIHRTYGIHITEFLKIHSHDYHDQEAIWKAFNGSQYKYYEVVELYEGMLELVAALAAKGFKQAVVTTRGNDGVRGKAGASSIVETSGLKPYIEACISGDDVKALKPDPEPVLMALEKLDVKAGNAVMIGDKPVDILAGKAAGTFTVGIDHEGDDISSQDLKDAGADKVVGSAEELEQAVLNLFETHG